MLNFYDLKYNPPKRWWKYFNWDGDSWALAEYVPELLSTVPQWWKYFKININYIIGEPPTLPLIHYSSDWQELIELLLD